MRTIGYLAFGLHSTGATMIPTVRLPRGVSVRDTAEACRAALEQFTALEVTRFALERWLSSSYRRALVGARDQWPSLLRTVDPVESMITQVQHRVSELRRKARDPAASFVAELPTRVNVVRVEDERGNAGFAPVDARGATLDVRVMSLFLADYLARPEYYLTSAARERWVTYSTFADR